MNLTLSVPFKEGATKSEVRSAVMAEFNRVWDRHYPPEQKVKRACQYPGCGRPHAAFGYCQTHYMQFRQGRPLRPVQRLDRAEVAQRTDRAVTLRREGLTYAAIAKELGVSKWSVESYIKKAIRHVRWRKDADLSAENRAWLRDMERKRLEAFD